MNFKLKGHELFVSKMKDQLNLVTSKNRTIVTSFLSPVEQEILKSMVGNKVNLTLEGGYENCERKVAILSNDDMLYTDVVCLHAQYDNRFKVLEHRDLLGCLMHLGIEREQLGDLIVDSQDVYIFTKEKMADFIIRECTNIGRCTLQFEREYAPCISHINRIPIQVNAASLRLDVVVSALGHCSRSKACEWIRQGFVKVNDVVLDEIVLICNNDFVSIRKIGRFQFKEVVSTTKKNRMILCFDQFK